MSHSVLPEVLEIEPSGPVDGVMRPPGSKSITNRALVCAALGQGRSKLTGLLDSVDTRVMVAGLNALGVKVEVDWQTCSAVVEGCGGTIPATAAEVFVENSGTTARFLAGVLALGHGEFRLDGNPRMRQRPIQDLLDGLRQLGAEAESLPGTGCPPIVIRASGLPGGAAQVRGDVSSQFLSGLLLSAPYAQRDVTLTVDGPLVSVPYVDMTLNVMRAFGVETEVDRSMNGAPTRFTVQRQSYQARDYDIEPDASAASYLFAVPAVVGGRMTVEGLSRDSLQGDVTFVDLLVEMGCRAEWQSDRVTVIGGPLRGITVDMNAVSDTVMTLAAVALFAEGPTTITHVAHIRHKETDRIHALAVELRKFGAEVAEHDDGLTITPRPLHGAQVDTYDDHRMAMSLALVGLRIPHVLVNDPACTSKTYPHFFSDLAKIRTR